MMASKSGVWKPTTSEQNKKIADNCEVSALKLSSGGGAAFVSLYNAKTLEQCIPANLMWVLDTSTTDNDAQSFPYPLTFDNGVYAVCEQGFDVNAVLCIATRRYTTN